MINIRFKNSLVSFHFTFFASLSLILLFKNESLVLMSVCACLIHEIGHIIAMTVIGEPIEKVVFYGVGVKIHGRNREFSSFKNDMIILSAGIVTNIAFAILIYITVIPNLIVFAHINLIIGLFNILPFNVFDGGRIREAIIFHFCDYETAAKRLRTFKTLDIICFCGLIVILIVSGNRNPWIYLSLIFFAIMDIADG